MPFAAKEKTMNLQALVDGMSAQEVMAVSAQVDRGVGRLPSEGASACELEALRRQQAGERPTYSTGICGLITCGYGRLDWCGYWEFPLPSHEPPNAKRRVNTAASRPLAIQTGDTPQGD